ncbi:IS701 family transposase [Kitasatospora sp. NPDC088391]|uniref:IS701 family transposase n=1 Tax=Kitasatospora sp. NPDC088391 TaxID=3364074 RepID=UPI003801153B
MTPDKNRQPPAAQHARAAELIDAALASVPRSDQRRWGSLYVRGLQTAEGRKTVRAVANSVGHRIEQNLNQFISKSPWEWEPVRRTLAEHLQQLARPRAWVVHPLVISKLGAHSVGVEERFVAELGRVVNCQRATGVWLAADHFSCPVDWRLDLSERWAGHPERRRRAAIPEPVRPESGPQHAVAMLAAMAGRWGLERRPVVMDLRGAEAAPVCRALLAHRLPFVVRIDPPARLPELRPAERAAVRCPDPAAAWDARLRLRRLPVEWLDHTTGAVRVTAVGSAPVELADAPGDPADLVLLASWNDRGRPGSGGHWLSNLGRHPVGQLYRTARLSLRVERDQAEVGSGLGLRDFEGRSFPGWHHHMTMVSLAHAVTLLPAADAARPAATAARVEPAA